MMERQKVILCRRLADSLGAVLAEAGPDRLFVLTDEHAGPLCLPLLREAGLPDEAVVLTVGAGDGHKSLDTLVAVWKELGTRGATRHSLLVNLGGGMVTDLGGFAAATFKRGIRFVNVPTTLLAMVDASVGGKTGINFDGLKNEVGAFAPALCVLIETKFLRTLDDGNFFSGYAEMLKHGLIGSRRHWAELLAFDTWQADTGRLREMVGRSVAVKEGIVEGDPREQGIRKALNFGHTVGHAFESLALEQGRPVLHGYAVAWGMVCELYLSVVREGFPQDKFRQTVAFIRDNYGTFSFGCDHYGRLYDFMCHDKKNRAGEVNFTLLADIGRPVIDRTAGREEIYRMLDFFREG